MFCVKCGVELADSERKCPLCGTPINLPEGMEHTGRRPYPSDSEGTETVNFRGVMFLLTVLTAIPALVCLLCDLQLNRAVIWSGYAAGGIVLFYLFFLFPFWFKRPNPAILIPCDFAAASFFLGYVAFCSGSMFWFWRFALPVSAAAAVITCTALVLFRYLRKGKLYVLGGIFLALGGFFVLLEFLLDQAFLLSPRVFWAFYPSLVCVLLGLAVIVIAVCRPLRESLHKKFFL